MNALMALADLAPAALAQGSVRSGGGGGGAGGVEAAPLFLVSPILPVLAFAILLGWARVVSSVYDKDATQFYLNRKLWNLVHLGCATAAVAALVLAPSALIGFPIMIALLAGDLVAYYLHRNKSDSVPAGAKWSISSLASFREAAAARKEAKLNRGVTLEIKGSGGVLRAPEKSTPEFDIRIAAESVIIDALERRASEFEIQPASESAYAVIFHIDGVAAQGEGLSKQQALAVVNLYKQAAGLDVEDYRRRQQGDIEIVRGGAKQRLRVTTSGGSSGVKCSVRFDPDGQAKFTVEQLGLLEPQMAEAQAMAAERKGTVLVTAPPRSGRTATLYAFARMHDAYTSNIQTIELEPVGMLEGVRHNKFDPTADGPDYATSLRSILRRDPDVVIVGELPDAQTAIEVAKADHDRIRTYVGFRADSALAAVQTFAKALGDPKLAGQAIHGVVCERLVRKLCENCRVEYQPTPDMLKKLGVPANKAPSSLFRKGGRVLIKNKEDVCPVCQGAGYFGQEGVFEIYRIDSEDRALIAKGDLTGLRAALRKKRQPSLQEAAVHKVLKGVTSVEEVVRVTSSGSSSKSGSSRPTSAKPAQAEQKPAPKPA
jgi:type II secretory ATPase GspE/PulE/Tfp pilus assembly ATPase PilB-like protein